MAPPTPAQTIKELLADLRTMYNNPDLSDVTFVCKDGERVPACRLLLAARSPVLNKMLTNGMAESRMAEIDLPEMTSPVLRCVLEFIHSAGIAAPLSWKDALEVSAAAKYLAMDSLEATAWAVVAPKSEEVASIILGEIAERLSAALEFPTQWDSPASARTLSQMVKELEGSTEYGHLRHLSETALRHLLEQNLERNSSSKHVIMKDRVPAAGAPTPRYNFSAYWRLRMVILWCAWQSSESELDVAAVSSFLPVGGESLSAIMSAEGSEHKAGRDPRLQLHGKIVKRLASCVEPWLPPVEIRRLHPALLVGVVEPLNVLSPSSMRKMMRLYVLERARESGSWSPQDAVDNGFHIPTYPQWQVIARRWASQV